MFKINYRAPYAEGIRTQYFHTLAEAQSMIEFYKSCGTKAWLV